MDNCLIVDCLSQQRGVFNQLTHMADNAYGSITISDALDSENRQPIICNTLCAPESNFLDPRFRASRHSCSVKLF
jgi:hypothetical protein